MAIVIEQEDREFIYGILGFPNLTPEDTGLLTDEIVDSQVIKPSLMEYFRWFPIPEIVQTQLTSGLTKTTIPWPDDTIDTFVFDVSDCRLAHLQDTNVGLTSGAIQNPFMQFRNISKSGNAGRLGSRFNYGFSEIQGSENFGNDAYLNQNQTFYNNTNYEDKTVTLFSHNPGTVQTTFARYSTDVNKVKFTSKREFLDLCRGEMLLFWANNLKRVNPEFPVAFDVDTLVEDGQDLVDKTIEKWKGKTKAVMMRN